MAGRMLERAMSIVFILATGARGVSACQVPADLVPSDMPVPMVTLEMPERPMYIGSYARVPVRIAPGLDLDIDDLAFRVRQGPKGGVVSPSRDATFDSKHPDIMLIAGSRPGEYSLDVLARMSGHLITSAPFRVTVVSADRHNGPSSVQQGAGRAAQVGSAWGGGPAGLQNVDIKPAPPHLRIALLFVYTKDQKFTPAEMPGIEATWEDNILNGVTVEKKMNGVPVGTEVCSVATFYDEASGGSTDVSLDMFGPYPLRGDNGVLLDWVDKGGPVPPHTPTATATPNLWEHVQAAINAADDDVVFADYNSILVVSRSVGPSGTPSTNYAWPMSSIGAWSYTTDDGPLLIAATQMPHNWGNNVEIPDSASRAIYETESHELAHSFSLLDQYDPDNVFTLAVDDRLVNGFELMFSEVGLPNFTIAHRLALGWLDPTSVRSFNFAASAAPVDEHVLLSPISADVPAPQGTYYGIEFRIADGLNYYSEMRTGLIDQIADGNLNPAPCVLNTDVAFNPVSPPPTVRPDILFLEHHPATHSPYFAGASDAYDETDTSTPGFPADFHLELTSISDTQADVHVTYGSNLVPDPSIRPWMPPPWQSPDIEVRNALNAVDDEWFNVPWEGHPNTLIAKVKNGGTLDAPGVKASFFVKDYNIGGSPESPLGSDTHDVARGDTVEFSVDWQPPAAGHKCIIVRIDPYTRPAEPGSPAVPETTSMNNEAQSNYKHFISPTASPAERQITQVAVGNPYDRATRVYLSFEQTNPLYRTYLEHTWLDLEPHESRSVTAMFEYVGEPPAELRAATSLSDYTRRRNDVSIWSFIVDPYDPTRHHMLPLGGADASVATGLATKFARFELQGGHAQGQVTTRAGVPVSGGYVIFTFKSGQGAAARLATQTVPVHDRGVFSALLPLPGGGEVEAYFAAPEGFGDATASASDTETPAAK
jgi:M6 family metalloprotease-like protein